MKRASWCYPVSDRKGAPMPRTTVRRPQWLKRAAENFAERDGVSVNQFIALAVAEKVGAVGAAQFFAERGREGDPEWAVVFLKGRPGEPEVPG